ncbi:MAG: choice-of-anchor D domain-containing protein [Ignavibacteria bacterium]|nr:choice-of-anchor D domain-containing protein [Ignavibacteria bacterium]
MKQLRLSLLLLLAYTVPVSAQWQWLNPLPEGNEFFDATFASPTAGWVVGGNGAIIQTKDGGVTWTSQNTPLRTTPFICLSVVFVDAQTGLVSSNVGTLLRTSDGGATWQRVPAPGASIQKLRRAPDGSVWGFGSIGALARTTDAGLTWKIFATGITSVVFDVSFPEPLHIVAACGSGTMLRSTDGGGTWLPVPLAVQTDVVSLDFVSATHGFAVQRSAYLLRTTDGGATWRDSTIGVNSVRAIRFADANTGWLLSNSAGTVFKTSDGGITWRTVTVDPDARYTFENVHVRSPLLALMVGDGGGMFQTTDGGASWTQLGTAITRAHMRAVSSVSDTSAWAFGDGAVFFTSDRGASWSANAAGGQPIHTGAALSATRIVAGGMQGQVYLSVNAGQSWTSSTLASAGQVEQIAFADANNGWLAGNHGTVARSGDGGATWTFTDPGVTDDFHAVFAVSATEAWIAGNGGRVMHTTDGGANWTPRNPSTASNLLAIHFTSATDGWVGGQLVLYKTTNGGQTWSPKTMPGLDVIYKINFSDPQNGFLLLSRGVARTKDGGQSFYRTDYPSTGLRDLDARAGGVLWLAGDFGTLQRYTPAPSVFINPGMLNFGNVATNKFKDLDMTIENSGERPMTIANVTALGAGFTVQSLSKNVLAPGEQAKATIRFAPADTGIVHGIAAVASNAATGVPSIELFARGVPPGTPAILHSLANPDFGKIKLGTIKAMNIRITNRGGALLSIREEKIVGADSLMFQLGRMSGFLLPASQSDSIEVVFAPLRPGRFCAQLIIDSDDPVEPRYIIDICGEAINPKIVAVPSPLDFGWVKMDSAAKTLFLEVRNEGTDSLLTSKYQLSGANAAAFSVIPPPVRPIAPGSSIFVPVSLKATGYGPYTASLLIESSDITNPGLVVPLQGNGTHTDVERVEGVPSAMRLHEGYPQPADARVVTGVSYAIELNETADIVLTLYDPLGRAVRTLSEGTRSAGMYRAAIPIDGLPGGLYIAELRTLSQHGAAATARVKTLIIR